MQTLLTLILCVATTSTIATEATHVDPLTQQRTAVLVELSQRSGLSGSELAKILSDCNGTQQSLYFCAWRDQIGSTLALQRVLSDKHLKFPTCKAFMNSKVESWTSSRDRSCARSAKKEFGEGSMKPTAQAMCVTAGIIKMTKLLERLNGCINP